MLGMVSTPWDKDKIPMLEKERRSGSLEIYHVSVCCKPTAFCENYTQACRRRQESDMHIHFPHRLACHHLSSNNFYT